MTTFFRTLNTKSLRCLFPRRYRSTQGQGKLYESIVDTIGNTPTIKINNIVVPNGVNMYVKAEFFNPAARYVNALITRSALFLSLAHPNTILEYSLTTSYHLLYIVLLFSLCIIITINTICHLHHYRSQRSSPSLVSRIVSPSLS